MFLDVLPKICVTFQIPFFTFPLLFSFVLSVSHRQWSRTLPGNGEHQDESGCAARCFWTPFAWIAYLPFPVVTAHLQEIPSREEDAHKASPGYQSQQRLLEEATHHRVKQQGFCCKEPILASVIFRLFLLYNLCE